MYAIRDIASHLYPKLDQTGNCIAILREPINIFETREAAEHVRCQLQDDFRPSNKAAGRLLETVRI